jgi:hypothetical protein
LKSNIAGNNKLETIRKGKWTNLRTRTIRTNM